MTTRYLETVVNHLAFLDEVLSRPFETEEVSIHTYFPVFCPMTDEKIVPVQFPIQGVVLLTVIGDRTGVWSHLVDEAHPDRDDPETDEHPSRY